MTRAEGRSRLITIGPIDVLTSILLAFNLAVAQPVLDLLGRNAEFFIAHDSSGGQVFGMAMLLTVGIPLMLTGLCLIAGIVQQRVGLMLHALILGALVALLVVRILELTIGEGLALWLPALAGAATGIAASLAYHSSGEGRRLVRPLGAVVPAIVVSLFLFTTPASKVAFPGDVGGAAAAGINDPAPIVFIVFDELPTASLMDSRGRIDARLFPNFAELAATSSWFRNATSVSGATTRAVPAILSGRYPGPGLLPIASDHPRNLFSLLAGCYEIGAHEIATQICSPDLCDRPQGNGWGSLIDDVRIVALHVMLPEELTRSLPPIDEAWGGFAQQETLPADVDEAEIPTVTWQEDRRVDFARFLEFIGQGRRPRLAFLHLMLPHTPWRYLPSGQHYPQTLPVTGMSRPEDGPPAWTDDEWLVTQGYQRHLLQLAFVDRLIGRLMNKLRAEDLFDRSLIVLVADHGAAFTPGLPRRRVTPETLGELPQVPLLIKRPSQRDGQIVDRPVETIDVLPTIIEVLGAELDWPDLDGISLFDEAAPRERERTYLIGRRRGIKVPAGQDDLFRTVSRKYRMLGGMGRNLELFRIGPGNTWRLVGRRLGEVHVAPGVVADVALDEPEAYVDVDPASDLFPSMLEARLTTAYEAQQKVVAIAVNGKIAAVTRTYGTEPETRRFYAMISPSAFRTGANRLEFFVVEDEQGTSPVLRPTTFSGP